MWYPLDVPFGFVTTPIFVKYLVVLAVLDQLLESGLPKMVNKYIGRADHAQPRRLYALCIVVILEHAYAKLLVQRSNKVISLSPESDAKHRQHFDLRGLPVMGPCVLASKVFHFGQRMVRHINFGFIPCEVRDWPNEAYGWVL